VLSPPRSETPIHGLAKLGAGHCGKSNSATRPPPEPITDWSLSSHGRYIAFQMAEVAIPRQMFQEILRLIAELRPQPPPAPA
jgi:hypothetical protein